MLPTVRISNFTSNLKRRFRRFVDQPDLTPISAEGVAVNKAGDTGEPNRSKDVVVEDQDGPIMRTIATDVADTLNG